jgi:nucleoside-diphosphate-sugar epimerase
MNTSKNIALVIGANGGIGRESCLALTRHGWQVRALVRTPPADRDALGVTWIKGDAMNAADVLAAAQGASVIVHAVNPPGYRGWDQVVLPMLDNTIEAARVAGARIVLPGTVYNYGPDALPLVREDSPQHPITRKGEIRTEMERRLAAAARLGVRTLVLRCGDFIGPGGSTWFAQGLFQPNKPVHTMRYPGNFTIGHTWAYLPDVGETLAKLLDRESELADFDVFNFGGYWLDGQSMAEAVRRAAHAPRMRLQHFPWWMTALLAPFVETMREVRKMRYLWKSPLQLDDSKLVAFLADNPYTPIDEAVHATLKSMGCLPSSTRPTAAAA